MNTHQQALFDALNAAADPIERFKQLYQLMNRDNLSKESLGLCYGAHATFIDPFHQLNGLSDIHSYFSGLYENVTHIAFDFFSTFYDGDHVMIRWRMNYTHPSLNRGNNITVEGCTEMTLNNDRIIKHHDFLDAGTMLYEHVPVLGFFIRLLKRRMS